MGPRSSRISIGPRGCHDGNACRHQADAWHLPSQLRSLGFLSLDARKDAGCQKVFAEKVSSVAHRTQLESAIDYAREGDVLVVSKLDRLARSVAHLIVIGERLDAKGVSLKVLEQAIETSTSTGRLMFNMLGAIAQFERELMLERQREGVAKAKAEGKYKGRSPTARAKSPEVHRLRSEGLGATAISKRLNISRASVYRVLSQA